MQNEKEKEKGLKERHADNFVVSKSSIPPSYNSFKLEWL